MKNPTPSIDVVKPRIAMGDVSREQWDNLTDVIHRYDIPNIKLTSGQRILLSGFDPKDKPAILADIIGDNKSMAPIPHYVQACPGTKGCKFAVADALHLGEQLEALVSGIDLPAKVKIGVSACPRCCAESRVRDLGFLAKKNGWTVTFGGNAGARPRIADVVAEGLNDEEALDVAKRLLEFYATQCKTRIRTARFVDRVGGIETIKNGIDL
ncbi:hypothetical protein [Desulfovibrio inopinatus]|uniref:hypothetical protein n=1 Tax=Desulfovibrio inopinatus TaxID=102109 RepID=UPI00040CA03D|nr:hypothetical protein [Desulfovibrio inopinatus]